MGTSAWDASGWGAFDDEPEDPDPATPAGLLELLDAQAALLVDVATGGSEIKRVNDRYVRRRRRLDPALKARGLAAPFPFEDLWAWRGHWQAQGMDKYQPRRDCIAALARPACVALEAAATGIEVADPGAAVTSTWADLNARLDAVVGELAAATSRDDVGRRCREILIDAAKLFTDPALVPPGAETPKAANAKAWLDLFLAAHAEGSSRAQMRTFVRATWDLSQTVTHGDIDRVDAYAAAQAPLLVVRVLQQLAP